MRFQVINDDPYSRIILELKKRVPEFITVFTEKDEGYLILGEFGRFLLQNLTNKDLVRRCFLFINEVLKEKDYRIEDALVVQIFEQIYPDKNGVSIALGELNGSALDIFNEFRQK